MTTGSSRLCPPATRRTASISSDERICFSTYPAAPAMIAWNRASSSLKDVRMRHAVRGWRARMLAAGFDPVAVLEPHVEHGDVRIESVHAGDRLGLGAGLADHRDVAFGFEEVANTSPHDLVVVEQEHADRHGHGAIVPDGRESDVSRDQSAGTVGDRRLRLRCGPRRRTESLRQLLDAVSTIGSDLDLPIDAPADRPERRRPRRRQVRRTRSARRVEDPARPVPHGRHRRRDRTAPSATSLKATASSVC